MSCGCDVAQWHGSRHLNGAAVNNRLRIALLSRGMRQKALGKAARRRVRLAYLGSAS